MSKIDDNKGEFGDVISFELASALKDGIDFLSSVTPIGEVVPIMVNIPGVPPVDSNIWQECNGSEITNPNSPLLGLGGSPKFTPNMIDRYLKVPTVFGQSGNNGGSNLSTDFAHDHFGQTGTFTTPQDADESDASREAAGVHSHSISSDLGSINVEPPFYTVKFFMRIQ